MRIAPFKKGPDYIDAAWLGLAAQRPCHHLDPYLMEWETILWSFGRNVTGFDGAVIEGNRGLFDGMDEGGYCSTAEVAKRLNSPVILVVDVTKMTRTAAALVRGVRSFDPEVEILAVVLNRVANARHESVVKKSIEGNEGIPVLGAIPRIRDMGLRERHLGLVPPQERSPYRGELVEEVAETVEQYVDVDALWRKMTERTRVVRVTRPSWLKNTCIEEAPQFKVGVIKDEAFHFYYEENLEALQANGATLHHIDSLRDSYLPPLDALYIGGGFPEVYAEALADNGSLKEDIRTAADDGLPIYAECGGLMYLGRSLRVDRREYPMVGALPVVTEILKRPQGHGYSRLEVTGKNPFFPVGTMIKGHEFHYSRISSMDQKGVDFAFSVLRGTGLGGGRDGMTRRNILATYTHLHALGCSLWAKGMARCAREGYSESNLGAVAPRAFV